MKHNRLSHGKGVTRRNIIGGATAAAAVLGTGTLLAQAAKDNCDDSFEKKGLFSKILYLWLVISTNPSFTKTPDYTQIGKITGLSQSDIDKAISRVNNADTIRKEFSNLVCFLNNDYPEGQCPKVLCVLGRLNQLKP
jgi:hypothetical protein